MNSPMLPIVSTMQLLISVTTIEEADIALENGADIIDLKDPNRGALGALPISAIQAIVTHVKNKTQGSSRLTSATIGDLPMQADLLLKHVALLATTGVDIIKIGFFETGNYQPCLNALQSMTHAGVKLIAVLFAEKHYPETLIKAIKEADFIGIMLDTANKNGATLLDYYSNEQRTQFAAAVFSHGLQLGLAGSLKLQHIDVLREINPTYIGFRGGVCDADNRQLSLDAHKIKLISKTM